MALRPQGVLVLRALGLGDLLTGVPALRAVRRALPGAAVTLAAPAGLAPVVSAAEQTLRLLPTGPLEPVPWSGPPPDVAVNLHGRGPQSHRVLQSLRPGRLVAFGSTDAGHDGPSWWPGEHERVRWCRLVEEALGVPADPADLLLPRHEERVPDLAVVHPGAASGARRWPVDRFAEVARRLHGAGHRVVVTGCPDEQALARELAARAGLPEGSVARTSLGELLDLVARAGLVVCGDTGVAHVASAYATPSVLLFGPTSPAEWGPPPEGPHVVLWHGDGTGDPHGEEPDPALLRITPDEVVAALEALPRAGRGPTAASAPAPRSR